MNRSQAKPTAVRRSGFTLIELLVVIGIIVILMGIILPAAGRVRVQAQNIASMARIKSVHGAIVVYQQSQGQAPGLFSNSQLTTGIAVAASGRTLTQTENMVISLVGGATNAAAAPSPAYAFDVNRVGQAVSQFGPSPELRKAFNPADVKSYLGNNVGGYLMTSAANPEMLGSDPATPDTAMPEFVDAFPAPRAILYMRATSDRRIAGAQLASSTLAVLNPPPMYYTWELLRYKRGAAGEFTGDFMWSAGGADYYPDEQFYMGMNSNQVPRSTTYVLIGAGPDRVYGTRDDLMFP